MKQKIFYLLLFYCCVLLATGCPPKVDEEGKKNVSGTVTFDGNPVKIGSLQFTPIDTKPREGAIPIGGTANIKNGKYELKRDLGLYPGTYRIRINAPFFFDPKTGNEVSEEEARTRPDDFQGKELIPDKYNTKTTLEITVGEEKNQTHHFELTK